MNAFLSLDGKKRLRMTEGCRNLLSFWRLLDEFLMKIFSLLFQPIMFRGEVRLNVEEKKTRAAREGDRRDNRPRGPGGTRGGLGGGIRGPPRGGMSQKPGFGAGRGIGQRQWMHRGCWHGGANPFYPFYLQICEFQPWVSWNVALACYRLLRLILFWPLFVCVMVLWFFFLVLVPDSSFVEQRFRKSGF